MANKLRATLLATTALGFLFCGSVQAADMNTEQAIKAMQAQIESLQAQLSQIQKSANASSKASTDSVAPAGNKEILPGVSVKLGGYIAAEGIWREKNQTTGNGSDFNRGIPFENERNAHHDEYRGSVQSTRLSLMAEGQADPETKITGLVEVDFSGSATTSNAVKTNSYVPRLRHAYITVDREDWETQFLVGQAYSLATAYKSGLAPRQEVGIATVDGSGAPGFIYTRSPSFRVVKTFADKKAHFGLSFENPYTYVGGLATPSAANVFVSNSGTGSIADTTYSFDYAPDVIAKFAYDSSFGHYEIFGLARFFRDIVGTTNVHQNYAMGLSGGASAYVSLLPKKLELAANIMAGRGIGRYGTASMPDVAFTPSGDIKPITQISALVGLITHPTPKWDVYLYAGAEKAMRQDYGNVFDGYGSSSLDNSGCYTSGGTCNAQTQMVWQITPGFWTKLYQGEMGTMKVGAQYAFTRRDAFRGQNNQAPHATENTVMVSFRYYPF